ncbi:MAG: hypothetical protein C4297_05735 [Gemmataceae bacterium]
MAIRNRRGLLLLVMVFSTLALGRAQDKGGGDIEAWLARPYELTVVVHATPHRLLTPGFVATLQYELAAHLKRDLGRGAVVQVADRHPLLDEVVHKGWQVLDRPNYPLDDGKLHFVLLDVVGGEYEVQSRQLDGSTGLASPIRRVRTPDRHQVARLASVQIAQDFGLVGVVTAHRTDKVLEVRFRRPHVPEEHMPPLLRVRAGEVYALSQIRRGSDGRPVGVRIPAAVLYAVELRAGGCLAQLFQRYQTPLRADRRTLAVRVIRLGTVAAAPRLQVVDSRTEEPIPGVAVTVSPSGFDTVQTVDLGATDARGWIASNEVFQNITFVKLSWLGRPRAQIPVPLLDDQPVVLRLTTNEEAEALAEFEFRLRQWAREVSEARAVLVEGVQQVQRFEARQNEKAALDRARQTIQTLSEEKHKIEQGLDDLRSLAKAAGKQAAQLLAEGEQYFASLVNDLRDLEEYVKREENPSPAYKLVKQARLREAAAEFDQAIRLYQQALKEDPKQPEVQRHLKELQDQWTLKSSAHKQARQFIRETWDKLTESEDIRTHLKKTLAAVDTCFKEGDTLTPRLVLRINLRHMDQLSALLRSLAPESSSEDQELAKKLQQVIEELAAANRRIVETLQKRS